MSHLIELVYIGLVITLLTALGITARGRVRTAERHYQQLAQLHRDLAEANSDLALYSFSAEDDKAEPRLRLADKHIEAAELYERYAVLVRKPFGGVLRRRDTLT